VPSPVRFCTAIKKKVAEQTVIDFATAASAADVVAGFKPTANPIVPANLKEPKKMKPHHIRHPLDSRSIANLADPKPKRVPKLKSESYVRANIYVREKPVAEVEPERKTVRAHVIKSKRHVKPIKPERVLVTANAHITPDEPKRKLSKRVRDAVVANAHIIRDGKRHAKKASRVHEFVTPIAHITQHIKTRKAKITKPEPEFVSARVNIFADGAGSVPQAPEPKEVKPEPELVSAHILRRH